MPSVVAWLMTKFLPKVGGMNMQFRYLFLLTLFCLNTSWAEFSDAFFQLHPAQPKGGEPYLIEITGEWPTDCHPGEQKPVISDYTGDTTLIEFETIVEHVTCNDVVTPYRVLIDMSDVIDSVTGAFLNIEVSLRFDGTEFTETLALVCICSPVPVGPQINPEAGLYGSSGLEKQGLLLARQNQRMAAYPLIYDESGSSEWVFAPGGIVEDVFFATLYELTGGQCLGCPPPDEQPELNEVGKLTLLMDSQGLVQMKVNDGLFIAYEQTEFGYGSRDVGGNPKRRIPDLSGRWAFVEIDGSPPSLSTPPPTSILPLVFDIALESVFKPDPRFSPPFPGNVTFSIQNIDGVDVAQMLCEYHLAESNLDGLELSCELNSPNLEDAQGDPYSVSLLSIERMIMTSTSPIAGISGIGTGIAVRID